MYRKGLYEVSRMGKCVKVENRLVAAEVAGEGGSWRPAGKWEVTAKGTMVTVTKYLEPTRARHEHFHRVE